jgi:hypothetical protein
MLIAVTAGCQCGDQTIGVNSGGGGSAAAGGGSAAAGGGSAIGGGTGATGGGSANDGGTGPNCIPGSTDLSGCSCTASGSQACYPLDVSGSTRNVGQCHDGMQTCNGSGEFATWGDCMGAGAPTAEICGDGADNDCNGLKDCDDPSCAQASQCNTSCTQGQTRPCYTGGAGTQGVGACHNGVQTCDANGQWGAACTGQQLPTSENCCDALDHNCNGLPGCLDFFSCLTAACCQTQCNMDAGLGCTCPNGTGDTATCPRGDFGVSGGGPIGGWDACCPCTANDCGNPGCCAEAVCAGNPACGSLTCRTLPASCNGNVNWDCDDFPEDCDEPCCPCTSCNCVLSGDACSTDSDCCSQSCSGTCN